MRSPGAFVAAALVALLLEVSFFPYLPGSPRPHLPLVLACSAGLVFGPQQGARAGLLAGLLVDGWIGRLVGSAALIHAGAGWLAGHLGRGLYRDVPGLAPVTAAVATFTADTLRGLLVGLVTEPAVGVAMTAGWPRVLLPDAVAAAIVAPLVFRFVLWMERRERAARDYGTGMGTGPARLE
ncbi:MAG TPA: rod shape-determining protein MreD [Thermaerobacter sp.]